MARNSSLQNMHVFHFNITPEGKVVECNERNDDTDAADRMLAEGIHRFFPMIGCSSSSYTPIPEWQSEVQSLECIHIPNSNDKWILHAGEFERVIRVGKDMDELLKILSDCGHLIKYYRVKNKFTCKIYENICFTLIPPKCKNIVNLNVEAMPSDDATRTCNMSKSWKNLEKITFKYLTRSTKHDFYKLLENNKNLKFLELIFAPKCINTDKFFKYIPDTIETLCLVVQYLDKIKFKYNKSAFRRFTSLNSLLYACKNLEDKLVMAFESLTSLKFLRLMISQNCESESTFDHIASLVNLEQLFLTDNDCLQDNHLVTIINGCKRLSILEITGCKNITDEGVAHVAKKFDGVISRRCDGLDIDDSHVEELIQKASNLKLFEVDDRQIIN